MMIAADAVMNARIVDPRAKVPLPVFKQLDISDDTDGHPHGKTITE
jgi:hypothetical protein